MLKGTKNELLGNFVYSKISATGIVDSGITHLRIYPAICIDTHESIHGGGYIKNGV
jgi:hypothetical protein